MDMNFWAIEVKPGETVDAGPGEYDALHVSQVTLGEGKKPTANAPVYVHVEDNKFVLGTLSSEKTPQFATDLVFDEDFKVSHGSKNASVFLLGYRVSSNDLQDQSSGSESDSEEELAPVKEPNGKHDSKINDVKTVAEKVKLNKVDGKPKAKGDGEPKKADKPIKVGFLDEADSEDDESDDVSDDDEDMDDISESDSDREDSSDEEEATPKKVESGKKRPAEPANIHSEKKAKVVTPSAVPKTGAEDKKSVHTATPYPSKQGGKGKGNLQNPTGSSAKVTCNSCHRNFTSPNALASHTKAKHGSN